MRAEISCATLADADAAFAAAAEAFAATRCMPAWQRSSILTTLADAIAGDKEEFSRIISAEAAKPRDVKSAEPRRHCGSQPRKRDASRTGSSPQIGRRVTKGVGRCSAASPSHGAGHHAVQLPLNLVAAQVGSAIAAGSPSS